MPFNSYLGQQINWLSGTATDTGIFRASAGTVMVSPGAIELKYSKLVITPEDLVREDFGVYTDMMLALKRSLVYHNQVFKRTTFTIRNGKPFLADAHLYGMPIICSLCENPSSGRELIFLLGSEKLTEKKDYIVSRYTFCCESCLDLLCLQKGISFEVLTW